MEDTPPAKPSVEADVLSNEECMPFGRRVPRYIHVGGGWLVASGVGTLVFGGFGQVAWAGQLVQACVGDGP